MATPFKLSDGSTIHDRLLLMNQSGNKALVQKLNPGIENVLGLRVPHLRALAKEIALHPDLKHHLDNPGDFYMEERMLHGMVLGQIHVDDAETYMQLVDRFVSKINSWSVCDTFTFSGRQKFVDANRTLVLNRMLHYLHSPNEYEVRFGVVMLMQHFIKADNADWFMDIMESVTHTAYYVRMAVAWAISVAYVKAPETVFKRLTTSPIDDWTFNKSISKIIESYRVADADKTRLRTLRRHRKQ